MPGVLPDFGLKQSPPRTHARVPTLAEIGGAVRRGAARLNPITPAPTSTLTPGERRAIDALAAFRARELAAHQAAVAAAANGPVGGILRGSEQADRPPAGNITSGASVAPAGAAALVSVGVVGSGGARTGPPTFTSALQGSAFDASPPLFRLIAQSFGDPPPIQGTGRRGLFEPSEITRAREVIRGAGPRPSPLAELLAPIVTPTEPTPAQSLATAGKLVAVAIPAAAIGGTVKEVADEANNPTSTTGGIERKALAGQAVKALLRVGFFPVTVAREIVTPAPLHAGDPDAQFADTAVQRRRAELSAGTTVRASVASGVAFVVGRAGVGSEQGTSSTAVGLTGAVQRGAFDASPPLFRLIAQSFGDPPPLQGGRVSALQVGAPARVGGGRRV